MDELDFQQKAATANDAISIDELCWKWLQQSCREFGDKGTTALKLLRLAEELLV